MSWGRGSMRAHFQSALQSPRVSPAAGPRTSWVLSGPPCPVQGQAPGQSVSPPIWKPAEEPARPALLVSCCCGNKFLHSVEQNQSSSSVNQKSDAGQNRAATFILGTLGRVSCWPFPVFRGHPHFLPCGSSTFRTSNGWLGPFHIHTL